MKSFERLVTAFRRFPGIGPKQAERLSLYVLRAHGAEIEELSAALKNAKTGIRMCRQCFDYTEEELCPICSDKGRDAGIICVVEGPQDISAVEKTRVFNGQYHVLHGSISPIDGIDQNGIKARELIERVKKSAGVIKEVLVATNPDTEGESTALYLASVLKDMVPRVTRIAYGVPLGGDLDYTDEMTLGYAVKGRTKI